MKCFLILSAVVLSAWSMPVDIGADPEFTDASVLISNGTRALPRGLAGFATLNGGTIGGAGGAVWTVWDAFALRDGVNGNDRRIVYVRGRIDLTPLFTGSPGVRFAVGAFKTIIGTDRNAMIFGGGLVVSNVRNVIIQNIRFHNALNYAPGEQPNGNGGIISMVPGDFSTVDALGIERNAENVWVDHCEFADDPWNWRNGPRRHDGLIDITRAASLISISNTIFRNHDLVTLVGNDDFAAAQDRGRLKVTFYLNWYQGTNQRNPLARFGEVHILNNLYTDIVDYGISVGTGSEIFFERNMMVNCRRGVVLSQITTPLGKMFNFNNWLVNSPIESGIRGDLGWNPSQYYVYSPMAAQLVGDHVRRWAGPQ